MLDEDTVRRWRWASQRLAPRDDSGDPAALVRGLAAVQSQDPGAAGLALRVRGSGFTAADVERARVDARALVRTRAHRDTLHLLATEDAGWMVRLLAPPLLAARRRSRGGALGLDDNTAEAGLRALREALADGPQTQATLAERLAARGLDLGGSRLTHLVSTAALEGWICDGPDVGRQRTSVLLADWVDVGEGPGGDAATSELARRHLAGHGPAEPHDLAAWSGMPVRDARAAYARLGAAITEVATAFGPRWVLAGSHAIGPARGSTVRLLAAFDTYLLGYRDRSEAVPAPHTRAVSAGGLRVLPAVAVDGVVVGTWQLKRRRATAAVEVAPFATLDPALLGDEVDDLGRFLGTPTSLA